MRYLLIALSLTLCICATGHAGFKEVFEKNFLSTPWAGLQDERSACVECHTSEIMNPELQEVPQDWQMSWHFQNAVSCHDCHGGDPTDATMSMSHQRGFIGIPNHNEIPEMCGKCHIAIKNNFYKSGHGKAPTKKDSVEPSTPGADCGNPEGPNCVTCHGSHDIQKASIDIINEIKCSKCHSYDRAREMKQTLFTVESKLSSIEKRISALKTAGMMVEEEEQSFFRTHLGFRALFHTVDVELMKTKTDEYQHKLGVIESRLDQIDRNTLNRKNFSAFIFLLFTSMCILSALYARCVKGKCDD